MVKKDEIEKCKKENGYIFTSDVFDNNISHYELRECVAKYNYEKVANGIYISKDTIPDMYYILSIKNKKLVFCLESALYLNGLMEHEPEMMTVSIPRGYNATHLREKGIKIISKNNEIYELGITHIRTALGNVARTYDMEKTICDIIKNKNKMDVQIFSYAMKEYVRRKDKNLIKLISYSRKMKNEDEVRKYLEVLM